MRKNINKVIYPELSYKIVGCLFEVFKTVGPNHREKYYQKAIEAEFNKQKIKFCSEFPIDLRYKDLKICKGFFDFLIDDKIILEIKVGSFFRKGYLEQILDYLKASNLKLGIIGNFTRDGVKFYRVLNIIKSTKVQKR